MNKRILIISHNVFSKTSSMGKTLASYFSSWSSDDLAQFYIHSEVPTDRVCENYYRVTDKDILKSIFTRKSGRVFSAADVDPARSDSRTDTGVTAVIYQKSRKRTPLIYFMRDLLWALGAWDTEKLNRWVDNFAPDAVFFASGDYGFMYRIAQTIAQRRKIPLFVCCMDDYYRYNKNADQFGGKVIHSRFMCQVKKTIGYASCLFSICDKMSGDYTALFNKTSCTLHTAASFEGPLLSEYKTGQISYIGNLGYNRHLQLVDIGRVLKEMGRFLDVYSSESRTEILKELSTENGIRFHGAIDAVQVRQVMAESNLLVHTESFEDHVRKSVAYSVSTKIADSLASGTCLLAYGPEEVASIQYLRENGAAYCITNPGNLEQGLNLILSDKGLRDDIVVRARKLAEKNHRGECVGKKLKDSMYSYM